MSYFGLRVMWTVFCSLRRGVGEEKFARVCAGLEKFVETRGDQEVAEGSSSVVETIDLLSSLGDFEAFKAAMLARRAGGEGGGGPGCRGRA